MQATWTFRRRYKHCMVLITCLISMQFYEQHHAGAETISLEIQMSNTGGSNVYPNFALDDVGCNGTESNLLDCLPWHNCGLYNRGAENAGVQCLRKGEHNNYYVVNCQ